MSSIGPAATRGLRCPRRPLHRRLIGIGCLGLTVMMPQAVWAAHNVSFDLGQIVALPDAGVGSVLAEQSHSVTLTKDDLPFCAQLSGVLNLLAGLKYSATIDRAQSAGSSGVFRSGIPGIGLQVEQHSPNAVLDVGIYKNTSFNSSDALLSLVCSNQPQQVTLTVRAIKTAQDTGSGAVQGGALSSFSSFVQVIGVLNLGEQDILTSDIQATVVASTCRVSGPEDITVRLPTVSAASFTGVGSVLARQAFAIELACSGADDARDRVALSLDYDTVPGLAEQGVLRNDAARPGARGVGVQVLDANDQPAPPNHDLEPRALANGRSFERFLFSARYYQTDAEVEAGPVHATARFTITYP